ncbi:MAG: endonuclease/exonuclease/phosphatase family protein [Planctomycetota bacterium]|nr:endonuclease/exonuclease/phosphatase family protein [Planctomycetota bacterium]
MLGVLLALLVTATAVAQTGSVTIRVATFNLEDVRTASLMHGDDARLRSIAEVIQRLRPNVILLNEITYDVPGAPDVPADAETGQNARRFVEHYLSVPQAEGLRGLDFAAFMAPTNTGMPSGFDLDRSGEIVSEFPEPPAPPESGQTAEGRAFGGDCWGFGTFPGQYGMALLVDRRLTIDSDNVRTFRLLPWSYMPGAFLPRDPETREPWYSEEELGLFRLSSKSHWDVPILLPNGRVVHLLCSHPTPPAFDGPEMRNKKRNHDEIRFWADYISGDSYIVDDANTPGGLEAGAVFVILGDLNADPDEGSSFKNPIERLLLTDDRIDASVVPRSEIEIAGLDADDTSAFRLRVDYVLPSRGGRGGRGVEVLGAGVWRAIPPGRAEFPSDHFPVWADLRFGPPLER